MRNIFDEEYIYKQNGAQVQLPGAGASHHGGLSELEKTALRESAAAVSRRALRP
jgi:hypothetical protein